MVRLSYAGDLMNRAAKVSISLIWLWFVPAALVFAQNANLPDGFVYLNNVAPDIAAELRYASSNNFIGHPIDGYRAFRCIITRPAAEALKRVEVALKPFGLGLKVFDAYRPQQAVDNFVRWAKDIGDIRMKQAYYPKVDKKNLFSDGYIAEKSGHSRGSTVDLTIISLNDNTHKELDMGTGFDFFGPESWPDNPHMTASQRSHRMLLQVLMKENGFAPYDREWWHFTLLNEPFPNTWFNFPVE